MGTPENWFPSTGGTQSNGGEGHSTADGTALQPGRGTPVGNSCQECGLS